MSDVLGKMGKNIYIDPINTAEDARKVLDKGLFYKQNRIEEVFHEKFIKLRLKIYKILESKIEDPLDYDVYANSILVDCRAMFLENKRYFFNSTLQGTYRARGLNEHADGIDEFFERKINENKTLKEAIKDWVDKRVAHYDYLEPEEEKALFETTSELLNRERLGNIFHDILIIAKQYEEVRAQYGSNTGEQFDKILAELTGGPRAED
ncbi:hypothetical protein TR80_001690 [Xanthomonas campestris]|uniref:hypothetical protein n=1 Tax=Xanthomonas campestris TaxID=339 RepID=UPI0011BF15D1|nr:hypothetical protein [Xanthomonas campestris]TXD45154.1 hypothetical protein TR80_001690 [Xanthomonas campestris]